MEFRLDFGKVFWQYRRMDSMSGEKFQRAFAELARLYKVTQLLSERSRSPREIKLKNFFWAIFKSVSRCILRDKRWDRSQLNWICEVGLQPSERWRASWKMATNPLSNNVWNSCRSETPVRIFLIFPFFFLKSPPVSSSNYDFSYRGNIPPSFKKTRLFPCGDPPATDPLARDSGVSAGLRPPRYIFYFFQRKFKFF